jgi:hypothetical protein
MGTEEPVHFDTETVLMLRRQQIKGPPHDGRPLSRFALSLCGLVVLNAVDRRHRALGKLIGAEVLADLLRIRLTLSLKPFRPPLGF